MNQTTYSSFPRYDTIESLFTSLHHDILAHKQLTSETTEDVSDILLSGQYPSRSQLAGIDIKDRINCMRNANEPDDDDNDSDDDQSSVDMMGCKYDDQDDDISLPRKKMYRTKWPVDDKATKCHLCHVDCLSSYLGTHISLRLKCKFGDNIYCLGCVRLLSFPKTKREKQDVLAYLITGKIPEHQKPPTLSPADVFLRLHSRLDSMRNRWKAKSKSGQFPLKLTDLMRIYKEEDQICQITGFRCYLHKSKRRRLPYWALTIDHITPVSHRLDDTQLWSAKNLQTMSSVLNNIKSDSTDDDLTSWYKRFLEAHLVAID
ncbi:hypothetical protein A0J61_03071 [Choanephora cucurbitarum]|uniref:Uncharacterized protein n=1 Tax=Choanephora cucurbitarum TaxID=101091 RepID=A0A1C7NIE2_9FUNG|nr:hypothetical protein A0J61_03071 [Choanephora cucurbitarum]